MRPYYEGWYMKQEQGGDLLAVIPGRSQDDAFIQVVTPQGAKYLSYPLDEFQAIDGSNGFAGRYSGMRIGESEFTPSGMKLHIHRPDIDLEGHLNYQQPTLLRYDIMGPFALIPMETKHTVFSMRHRVDGEFELNGVEHCFENAAGYMEGDRGHSFPRGYTWVQSVDFDHGASVMLALAEIPLGAFRFMGCIAVVSLGGEEYRMATYLGVRIVESAPARVEIAQRDLRLRVEVLGSAGHGLQAPDQGSMRRIIHESPSVPAHFLFEKGGRTLLDHTCNHASYEYVPG